MRFITVASYHGTGSSAVTDFVSEFSNVYSFTDEEVRFLQDPDCISELEFNLVECFNRHNSGHALKRYKRMVDFYNGGLLFGKKYFGLFGDNWKKLSYRYIDELTDFTYKGWWLYDLLDRGYPFYFRKRMINKFLHMTIWRGNIDRQYNSMKSEITYCSHPSEQRFLEVTQRYIHDLFSSVVPKDKEILMVDQLLPPMNAKRYLRYFCDDIQVVIVDRDPRDMFVIDKYLWKDGAIPSDVEVFCKWFKYTRSHRKIENLDNSQIKFIRFEDLIYDYERTTSKLASWLKLDFKNHKNPRKFFNPNISIKNTQVWRRYPQSLREVEYINRELSEYLYDFERMKIDK